MIVDPCYDWFIVLGLGSLLLSCMAIVKRTGHRVKRITADRVNDRVYDLGFRVKFRVRIRFGHGLG